MSVSLAAALNREHEHMSSKAPEELPVICNSGRRLFEGLLIAIQEDRQCYIPEDFNILLE